MRLSCLGAAAAVRDALLLLTLFRLAVTNAAADATADPPPNAGPLWLQPSTQWCVHGNTLILPFGLADRPGRLGIDGTWSTFTFYVGSPAQVVYLGVATTLSELWVVSNGGCVPGQSCLWGGRSEELGGGTN